MRRWINSAFLALVVGFVVVAWAAGPMPHTVTSGTSDIMFPLADTTWVTVDSLAVNDTTYFSGNIMYIDGYPPAMVELKFPDADVTYSFWEYANPDTAAGDTVGTWTLLTDNHAIGAGDTVGTLFSGDILRSNIPARFVYINRTGVTGGIINRYY